MAVCGRDASAVRMVADGYVLTVWLIATRRVNPLLSFFPAVRSARRSEDRVANRQRVFEDKSVLSRCGRGNGWRWTLGGSLMRN